MNGLTSDASRNKGKTPVAGLTVQRGTPLPGLNGVRSPFAAPPKKLVFKGFKVKPKLPENYEEDTWEKLKRAVHAIHDSRAVPDSLEELYNACENLCHHKKADMLYTRLKEVCDRHVKHELTRLKENMNTGFSLKTVDTCWTNHCRQMIMIRSIFLYLDRTYVLQSANLKSLWDLGLDLFRTNIMDDVAVKQATVAGICAEIEKERNGDKISPQTLHTLTKMFLDLSIYITSFESHFIRSTESYYHLESDRMIKELDVEAAAGAGVARYLKHVESRLGEEEERCKAGKGYVDNTSRKRVMDVVEGEMVRRHVGVLLEKGFDSLMEEHRIEDLGRMYTLFGKVGGQDDMRKKFADYIRKTGLTHVSDPSRDATMVEDLLTFKSRCDEVLHKSFANDEHFSHSLKESFENFINKRQNKPAEMIAKFVDAKLKSGKGVTEEEVEGGLDRCLVLFRFIQGKDVFEAFYKKDLAKRLLLGRSSSVDSEKSMLSKLKTECGAGFTSKLEGMFKDMDVSRDIMVSFRESSRFVERLGPVDLNVNVLTAGYWPTYPPAEVIMPMELAKAQDVFREFYLQKHNGRRLTWQHSLGQCVLKADLPKGRKELSVSLFQTLILLLFNNTASSTSPTLTYNEISQQTNIPPKDLAITLQSLACGKIRILQKHPKGKDINETDSFSVNEAFENPLTRIKVNSIQMKESVEERERTEERVFADRQYQVDAAIVRIMKMRKRIGHAGLLSELFEVLRFAVKASDLKKRIESLIDREYMERDAKDSTIYNYVA
ncbi:Cullin-4 [Rhizophlyctis rosea]|uniref:Cullin-4 n=1 Tax=Rhizophlyctis rosea TaxID=64517 RepID=A0AAD5SA82_9FUNG|nr:Cullin-4 [Rhizophlyctis rosea]